MIKLHKILSTSDKKKIYVDITHAHANFYSCFSVSFTQMAAVGGNVNEWHITSSAPDDIFQETPTQAVENTRGKGGSMDRLTQFVTLTSKRKKGKLMSFFLFLWRCFKFEFLGSCIEKPVPYWIKATLLNLNPLIALATCCWFLFYSENFQWFKLKKKNYINKDTEVSSRIFRIELGFVFAEVFYYCCSSFKMSSTFSSRLFTFYPSRVQ